jgi:hypothetical protein
LDQQINFKINLFAIFYKKFTFFNFVKINSFIIIIFIIIFIIFKILFVFWTFYKVIKKLGKKTLLIIILLLIYFLFFYILRECWYVFDNKISLRRFYLNIKTIIINFLKINRFFCYINFHEKFQYCWQNLFQVREFFYFQQVWVNLLNYFILFFNQFNNRRNIIHALNWFRRKWINVYKHWFFIKTKYGVKILIIFC